MDALTRHAKPLDKFCPLCHNSTWGIEKPEYVESTRSLFFRGKHQDFSLTQGAIVERIAKAWPNPVLCGELYKVWGALDVDATRNLKIQVHKIRKKMSDTWENELRLKNVRSDLVDHLSPGYYFEWDKKSEDITDPKAFDELIELLEDMKQKVLDYRGSLL